MNILIVDALLETRHIDASAVPKIGDKIGSKMFGTARTVNNVIWWPGDEVNDYTWCEVDVIVYVS